MSGAVAGPGGSAVEGARHGAASGRPERSIGARSIGARLIGSRAARLALRRAGVGASLIDERERRWASAIFVGNRHTLTFELRDDAAGRAARAALEGIAREEFQLAGAFVADAGWLGTSPCGRRVSVELLVIEDR